MEVAWCGDSDGLEKVNRKGFCSGRKEEERLLLFFMSTMHK